jgi:hypothetical protein
VRQGRMTDEDSAPNGRRKGWLAPVVRAAAVMVLVASGAALLARSVDPAAWLTADGLRAAVGADRWYGPVGYVSTVVGAMFVPVPKVVLLASAARFLGPGTASPMRGRGRWSA